MTLCSQVLEADGGYWGCRLPAFHKGPHDVSVPTRRRTPPTPASSCLTGGLARHGAARHSPHHHLTGKAASAESASHRLGVPPGVAAKGNLTAACGREGEEKLARSAGDELAFVPRNLLSGGSGRSQSLAVPSRRDVAVHARLRACTGENASACEGATAKRDPRGIHTDTSTPHDPACAFAEEDDVPCPSLSPSHCPAVHARLRACTAENASACEGGTAKRDPRGIQTDASTPHDPACAVPEEDDAPCPSLSPSHSPAVHARLGACTAESAGSCEGGTVRSDPWWTQTHTCTPLNPASAVPEEDDVPCPSLSPSHCPDVPVHAVARTSGTAEGVKWRTGPWTSTDPCRATPISTVAPAENSSHHHSLTPFLSPAVAMHAPRDTYDPQYMSADPCPYGTRVAELPVARNHLLHHPSRTPCTSFPSAVAVVTEFALVSPPPSAYISPSPLHPHLTTTAPNSSLARSRGLSARPARQPFKQLGLHKVFPPAPFASDDFKPQWQQSSYGCSSSWNGVEAAHTLEPLVTARAPEVATPMHAALGVRHKRRFPHHVIGSRTHRMPLPFNEADEPKGPPRFACGSWTFSSDPCKRLRLKLVRSHPPRSEMSISFQHTEFSSEGAPAAPAPAAPPIKKSHKKKRPPDSDPPTVVAANKIHKQKSPLESASPNLAAPKKSHKKKRPLEGAPPASAQQEKVVPGARSPSEKGPASVEATDVGTQLVAPLSAGGDSPPGSKLPGIRRLTLSHRLPAQHWSPSSYRIAAEACEWEEQQQRSPSSYGLREHQELVRTSLEEELCSAFASTDTWASAGGGSVQQAAIFQEFMDLDKMNDCEIHNFLSAPEMRSFLFSGDSAHLGSPRRNQSLAGTTPGASQASFATTTTRTHVPPSYRRFTPPLSRFAHTPQAASTSSAHSIQDDDHVSEEDSMQQRVLDELSAALMAPSDVATVFESLVALPTD
ncbi:hypothetical protein AB1Y20_004201 [Prymnesium parvum]|uniref:Uncharacterized protein n=1 Tax=Prymnesium parvum TaxID=97485 RepID=A0AB34J8G5_PRYPA